MTIDIIVPTLGESITKATIARWYKVKGEQVKINDILLELETEKVTLEVNATADGFLGDVLYAVGQDVEVGQIIGSIDDVQKPLGVQDKTKEPEVINKQIDNNLNIKEAKVFKILSPAAQNIAIENNVDVNNLEKASGKDGRFTKQDITQYISNTITDNRVPTTMVASQKQEVGELRETRQKMTKLRQTIAKRLKDSQNTAAILTTFNEVDMYEIIQLRNKYKVEFEKKYNSKLGFMSFFVKACVSALQDFPNINAQISGDEIIYKNYYDIGVAVGTESGLVVPIIRDADKLSFSQIENAITTFGIKASTNKLAMNDLMGGTFSISNGGVYGSMLSTPIINPPQSAILGMHKIQDKPVVLNGQIVIRPMMYLALSYDHRIIDGKEAVTFLVKVKNIIEQPDKLLLGL